ncbi:hypothetical protein [Methylobacterium nodulans]|uniref:Uncharacterized protein n=1 Tax=Methylobacterium nodulans (strain LMG 21967 / CNCM I-2342 / ORS 2060) TaxID=460265 RepID=B8IAK1_METNO|nr:hypothetical protein [Methylobacterium nodulans]ACL61046.1 hypothetical protein Mnod_6240 [Methylobacterium nodulans ORS 2060]
MGLLDQGFAGIFGAGFGWIYAEAVYTVDLPGEGGTPWDPAPPTPTAYPCKAMRDEWTAYERQGGLIAAQDWKVLVLTESLPVTPVEGGRITLNGQTLTIASAGGGAPAITTDPGRGAWVLRCRL